MRITVNTVVVRVQRAYTESDLFERSWLATTLKVDGVCQLLIERDFAEDVVEIFRENRIDGIVLRDLTVDDMKELGLIEAVKSGRHAPVVLLESPRGDSLDKYSQSPLSDFSPTLPQAIATLDTPPPRRRVLNLVGNVGPQHQSKPKQSSVSITQTCSLEYISLYKTKINYHSLFRMVKRTTIVLPNPLSK